MVAGSNDEDAKVVKQLLTSVGLCEQVPEYQQVCNLSRGGGSGCAGCAIAHPIFSQMTIFTSFLEKKRFLKSDNI